MSYISAKCSTYIRRDACKTLKGLSQEHTKMTAPLKERIVKSQREVKPQQDLIAKGLTKWHFPIKGDKDHFEK